MIKISGSWRLECSPLPAVLRPLQVRFNAVLGRLTAARDRAGPEAFRYSAGHSSDLLDRNYSMNRWATIPISPSHRVPSIPSRTRTDDSFRLMRLMRPATKEAAATTMKTTFRARATA